MSSALITNDANSIGIFTKNIQTHTRIKRLLLRAPVQVLYLPGQQGDHTTDTKSERQRPHSPETMQQVTTGSQATDTYHLSRSVLLYL